MGMQRAVDTVRTHKGLWWLALAGAALVFLLAPGALVDKLAALTAGVSPHRPAHSYFLAGTQLPLEARMTGIFGGFLCTVLWTWACGAGRVAQLPTWRGFAARMALVAVMGADALNAIAYDLGVGALYQPNNAIRLATGLLAGIATAQLFLPVGNAWTWRAAPSPPAAGLPLQAAGAVLLATGIWLATVAGWDIALYPLALLSTGGLLLAVWMLNLLLVLRLARAEGESESLAALGPYGVAAAALGVGELVLLAALRYGVLGIYSY